MSFEDLDAWRKARLLVNQIYALTRQTQLNRDFGLCSQSQRAAVSVMSNIAEGFERIHPAEKLQAYNIARGSCGELRSLLYVVEDNFPETVALTRETRQLSIDVGCLSSDLIAATRKRLDSTV